MPPKKTTTPVTDAAIKKLIAQGVADALAEYEATKNNGNGDDSHDSGSDRRTERTTRVIGLTQWFERMESIFHISNCTVGNQIKFATCTLLGSALTWWNSHVKAIGHNSADVSLCIENMNQHTENSLFIRSGSRLDTAHEYAVSSLMDMAYWSLE
ncbi:hypothetical protein Tco_0864122 [Tanacetum coccineum]